MMLPLNLHLTFLALLLLALAPVRANEQPNIIMILADDMGYSDLGCFGSEIPTPNLDALARNGVRLTRCRNASMCVVTRASLMTGKWWPSALPTFSKTVILPEALKEQSYRTALFGKWHLNGHPMDHGFDHFFGFLNGFTDHFAGSNTYRLDRKPFTRFGPDYYSSDAFADRAISFIKKPSKDPFFVYLSFQAPHNPLQAPKADILKHRGNYLKGWQDTREARFAKQKQLGLFPAQTSLPAYPQNLPDWTSLTPAQRDLEDLRMATYAAMIERMDLALGRLISALKSSHKFDNTLILFLSDNGTDSFSVVDKPMLAKNKLPGDPDSNWQPGTGWAYTSVTPWRLYKISQHNGGVTTGAIAHWPAGIPQKNAILHHPVHVVDFLPTLLEASGKTLKRHGTSFLPLLKTKTPREVRTSFYQYMDHRAIRTGKYTLVEADANGWELFDHQKDPLETNNLAPGNPKLVKQLSRQWDHWWTTQNQKPYAPKTTKGSPHYHPQGDQGSGERYLPSAMPADLANRYPIQGN